VPTSSTTPVPSWIVPLWFVGVLLCSLRAVGSAVHVVVISRRSTPADSALVAMVADLARTLRLSRAVRVVTSAASRGPATFGAFRPVIVVPAAAIMGLTAQQLEAVLAHELAHIRRHDYLVNIAQVLIETLVFYHPAVWWASTQIRLERELCCDDVAVQSCGDRLGYAQALTALARLPLASARLAPGAASGPLVRRIQRVLGLESCEHTVSLWPAVLAVALLFTCAAANSWAQSDPSLQFEVASVKQNRSDQRNISIDVPGTRRFTTSNVTLRNLIRFAYAVDEASLVAGPDWIRNERYDINATADRDIPTWTPAGPPAMLLSMVRSLLADRFQLSTHEETRELPVFALVLARADRTLGPRASASTADCNAMLKANNGPQPPPVNPGDPPVCGMRIGPGQMLLGGVPMSQFASVLSPFAQRLVIDRTGLSGAYNLQLSWTPLGRPPQGPPLPDLPPLPPTDPNGASLFVSMQEQLGLKLEATRAPMSVVVIDRVERPAAD
jgi:bla regulator protein blaR1